MRGAVIAALLAIALFVLPATLGIDWIKTLHQRSPSTRSSPPGSVVLYGRVGMISLGQIALLAIGTWTRPGSASRTDLPFPLLILAHRR